MPTPSISPGKMLFRPFAPTPEPVEVSAWCRALRHPVFAWMHLRPIFAQHTRREHEALQRWVEGRKQVVEIGVAEGASAMALRQAMAPSGSLTLIDPFQLSRVRSINATRRAARAAVNHSTNGRVHWIEQFSMDAVRGWALPIDFLFLDGDHAESAVWQDWKDWHPFVEPGGLVVFHDARVFPQGWPAEDDGPVRVVNALFRRGAAPGWRILEEVDSLVAVQRQE
jgi:predicted O-methyltransferase YrrM